MSVHLDTLKKVRIFQECERGLLTELVLKLKLEVFSPGDYVCRKGDVGREMYIIKSGKLDVVSPDGTKVFVTLGEGVVFGELSILNVPGSKMGNRRTANVRSKGYSNLFSLHKDDLWAALNEYPDAKKLLLEIGKEILAKDNMIDEEKAKREEAAQLSLEQKVVRLKEQIKGIKTRYERLNTEYSSIESVFGDRIQNVEK